MDPKNLTTAALRATLDEVRAKLAETGLTGQIYLHTKDMGLLAAFDIQDPPCLEKNDRVLCVHHSARTHGPISATLICSRPATVEDLTALLLSAAQPGPGHGKEG